MADLDKTVREQVEAAIYAGKKIDAIRLYREAVPGTDLVDAKKAVEEMQAQLRQQRPENFGPAPSKTGCLGIVLVMAGMAGSLMLLAAWVVVWN